MKLKKNGDKHPSANLAINNSRIKKYGKETELPTYYLENGQEFQIELFNPTQGKILTKIKLDGKNVSGGGLILRPGERAFLERFVETNKKFLFETYNVDNKKSSKKAIELNGNLEVEFFKEYIKPEIKQFNTLSMQQDFYIPCRGTGTTTNINYMDSSTSQLNVPYTLTTTNSGSVTLDGLMGNSTYTSNASSGMGVNSIKSPVVPLIEKDKSEQIETGRIEEGSISNQKLVTVGGRFKTKPLNVVNYKLLPKSQEVLTTTSTYYRSYCGECGKRCNTKFCPVCGKKQ